MLQSDILNIKIWYDLQDSWLFENWVGQHSYSTLWVGLSVKTPSYACHPVSQRSCAFLSHFTWCKATMSACRCLIWGKDMAFISCLFTWEHSLGVWPAASQPTIYHEFPPQPKIRICKLSREILFINILHPTLSIILT